MKKHLSIAVLISALTVALVLSGCGEGPNASPGKKVIRISDPADLPAVIAPDTVIELPAGMQNISDAFGDGYAGDTDWEYAYLEYVGDGYELVVRNVSGLTIRGAGTGKTELAVGSFLADVIRFENCNGVTLEKMTMGHHVEPGGCGGAVVEVDQCSAFELRELDLYGCGTYGVENYNSQDIVLENSVIRSCSYGIISCCDGTMTVTDCEMKDCEGYISIDAADSVIDFTGCTFQNNKAVSGFAPMENGNSITFDNCSFSDTESFDIMYGLDGTEEVTFTESCGFDDSVALPNKVVAVHNTEELFEAIAPDTSIVLLDGWYNMSDWLEATYAEQGSEWNSKHPYVELDMVYDGVMATVSGVKNLAIVGGYSSRYAANITVAPRYADVLCFEDCDTLTLANLSAGHTDTGECSGSVVMLSDCSNVNIRNCDLFGCGVEGIYADGIRNLNVTDTHIRDCSSNALRIYGASGEVIFRDCALYNNGGGVIYQGNTPVLFDRCALGTEESNSVAYLENAEIVDCELNEDWEGYEYPDIEDDTFYPLEGLTAVRFDREVLRGTDWNAYYLLSGNAGEWLDNTVQLRFDADGNCVFDGYYNTPVALTLEYDSAGYLAAGYEDADEYYDGQISLYADTSVKESDIILTLEYEGVFFYFTLA